jgi:hypothetical protein
LPFIFWLNPKGSVHFEGATYERLDPGGPKKTGCSADVEFVTSYFTCPKKETLEQEMEILYTAEESGLFSLAEVTYSVRSPLSLFYTLYLSALGNHAPTFKNIIVLKKKKHFLRS